MPNRRVFAFKLRPWNEDSEAVWTIAYNHRVVFVGYPPLKPGAAPDPHHATSCLYDLRNLPSYYSGSSRVSLNGNVVHLSQAADACIAVVPRSKHGVVYAGNLGHFELVDNPPWLKEALNIHNRPRYGLEFVQIWRVAEWVPISYPLLPGWLISALSFRNLVQEIKAPFPGQEPYQLVSDLMKEASIRREPTADKQEIRNRLAHDLTPAGFEHLVVALLQLEQQQLLWRHVGGPGDGGVDAIGSDDRGHVCALVQCKLGLREDPNRLAERIRAAWPHQAGDPPMTIVASLLEDVDMPRREDLTLSRFLSGAEIVDLVWAHRDRLPMATTLRLLH